MNDRIRELAFECARQLNWNPPSDPKEYTFSSAGLEKFAELIVRECMAVANTYQNRGGNCYVDDMIAKHFGVE